MKFSHNLTSIFLIFLLSFSFIYYFGANGIDWKSYSTITINFTKLYFYREPVSWFLISIIRDYGHNLTSSLLLFFLSIVTYNLIFNLTNNITVSLLFTIILMFSNFYLLLSLNGLRQGIALIFFLLSLSFYFKRNFIYFACFFVFAMLSHNSILLFYFLFVFYFIKSLPIRSIVITSYFLLSPLIILIGAKNDNPSITNSTSLFLLVLLFLTTVLVVNKKKYRFFIEQYYVIMSFIAISLAFISHVNVFARIVYYTIPLVIIFSSVIYVYVKPFYLSYLFLFVFLLVSAFYSLTHPSVLLNLSM